ncbi:unnamed protein product, partial [Didymodactylos carnosus]
GEELGEYKEKTPGVAKIDWSLIDDRNDNSNWLNKQHLQFYKDLIHLRKSNLSLYTENVEFLYENSEDGLMLYYRWNGHEIKQGEHLIVLCNWSSKTYPINNETSLEIPNIPKNGKWYDWLNENQEYNVENNILKVDSLKDHQARIFIFDYKKDEQQAYDKSLTQKLQEQQK